MPESNAEKQLLEKLLAAARNESSFDANDPNVQILLLAQRVENLGREKEVLERALEKEVSERIKNERETQERLIKMEKAFQRGAGIMMILPFAGTAIGLLLAYGKIIFAPWTRSQ